MKKIAFLILCILNVAFCFSQDTTNSYHIKYYTGKVQNYLDKEKALFGYYSVDKEGIKIFASATNKAAGKSEFVLSWHDLSAFQNVIDKCPTETIFTIYKSGAFDKQPDCNFIPKTSSLGEKKLAGYRIAIDAGHIAGDLEMGELEKKHVKFKKDSLCGLNDSIDIAEGTLTFATAKLLKDKLEADGAQVFMTRTENGSTAFGKTFREWLKSDYKAAVDSLYKLGELSASQKQFFLGKKANDRDKFRVIFKDMELQKRGEIINNYKPDITIIIHYNVDETNTGWVKPGKKDFNMTFVGGAFMKGDLSTPEKRFEFLRLLITDDLERSIVLSSDVVNSFEKNLKVPTADIRDAKYLVEGCLPTPAKGVYCRNLQLTRFVHSPLVYGETLYQDNLNECKLLNKEADKTKNERVQQVADAYYQGILNYLYLSK